MRKLKFNDFETIDKYYREKFTYDVRCSNLGRDTKKSENY